MLRIQGTITEGGGPPAFPVALRVAVTVLSGSSSVFTQANVESVADGSFVFETDSQDDAILALGTNASVFVALTPYLPGATVDLSLFAVIAATGAGQDLVEAINEQTGDLDLAVDLAGLTRRPLTVGLMDDRTTSRFFDEVDSLEGELLTNMMMGGPPPIAGFRAWGPTALAPFLRVGDGYRGAMVSSDIAPPGQVFLRFSSLGPRLPGEVMIRTRELPSVAQLGSDNAGAVFRVDEEIGIGTLNAGLPDRSFSFPILVMDPDLDVVDSNPDPNVFAGELRIRADVGLGTSVNLLIVSLGRVDARFTLTPRNHEGGPFDEPELGTLFDVTITSVDFEVTPGTDLDDLPFWAYLALSVFSPTLGAFGATAAATTAAIELAVEQILPGILRGVVEDSIGPEVRATVDRQLASQAADNGLETVPDAILDSFWFEAERVEAHENGLRIFGWAGIWHGFFGPLVAGDGCPTTADADAGSEDDAAARSEAFRPLEHRLDVPPLRGWMREFERHRKGIFQVARKNPGLVMAARDYVKKHGRWIADDSGKKVFDREMAAGAIELVEAARAKVEPRSELGKFFSEVSETLKSIEGASFEEARAIAAKRLRDKARAVELDAKAIAGSMRDRPAAIVRLEDLAAGQKGQWADAAKDAKEPSSRDRRARRREDRRGK